MRKRYRDFSYILCSHTHITIINKSHQSGTVFTIDKPILILHNHPKFIHSSLSWSMRALHWAMQELLLHHLDPLLWWEGSVVVAYGLSGLACGILVPWPGIEPAYPALQGGFLATGPLGKSLMFFFYLYFLFLETSLYIIWSISYWGLSVFLTICMNSIKDINQFMLVTFSTGYSFYGFMFNDM